MKHERRQHEVKGFVGENTSQIAHVALDYAGATGDALLRKGNHCGAAVDSDHASTVAHQPIGVPAVTATGIKNIDIVDRWQERQCRWALVKSIPWPFIDLRRITPGDGVIVCRFGHSSHTSDTAHLFPNQYHWRPHLAHRVEPGD